MSEAKRSAALRNLAKASEANGAYLASLPLWKCAQCDVTRPATVHQKRQTYCSRKCMSAGYSERMTGEKNPNHRNAGGKTCERCGAFFRSYNKDRKYCSLSCAAKMNATPARQSAKGKLGAKKKKPRPMCQCCGTKPVFHRDAKHCGNEQCAKATRSPRKKKEDKEPPAPNKVCAHCRAPYHSYNKKRLYCSYQCHVDSGGAFRAGLASKKAVMKYGAKKDANHAEIMEAMRQLCAVYDLSAMGFGVPDGIAWADDQWRLFDIKNPKTAYGRRGLNKVQKKWISQFGGGPVFLIYTVDEAERFARGQLDGIKSVSHIDLETAA